jgi:light-independent protochlorophyllide reductase subunit B
MAAKYLQQEFDMPYVDITPMGVVETARCIRAIAKFLTIWVKM